MNKWASSGLYVFVVFVVWLVASSFINQPLLLPSPVVVFQALGTLFTTPDSIQAIMHSLFRLLVSGLLSFATGALLGIGAYSNRIFKQIINPIITLFRTIPVVSIIVILLILLGIRLAPFMITFLMLVPLSYQAVLEGLSNIDSELIDVYILEDNHVWKMIWYCYFPLIAGYLKTAILQSGGLGIKVLVMAEYLAQTPISIGARLYMERVFLRYDYVFAWTILLVILALLFEFAIHRSKQWLPSLTDAKSPKR